MLRSRHFLSLFAVLAVSLSSIAAFARNDVVKTIRANNEGKWGGPTGWAYCPEKTWAAGYAMRVEPHQKGGDDTALNAVALYCKDESGYFYSSSGRPQRVVAFQGKWGDWREGAWANDNVQEFFTGFQLMVEGAIGKGDDTAANSVRFKTNANRVIDAGNGGPWGGWGNWSMCPAQTRICGINIKFESPIGSGDDTGMNGAEFACCRY